MSDGPRCALPVLLGSATLVVMAGAVISPVITLIRDDFGLSPGAAGLVITTHSLLIAISAPFVGALIDRVGTRRVLLGALVAYAVFGSAGAFATSYPVLLSSRAAFGVAAAGVTNGLTVSLLNLWHGRARDAVLGYRASANSIGGVAWPLGGGALGGLIGWQGPFVMYAIALPIAVAAVWLVPDSRPDGRTGSDDVRSPGGSETGVTMHRVVRRRPVLLWLYALIFLAHLLLYTIIVFLPQRLHELGVTQPPLISVFLALVSVAAALVGLVYGRIRRWLRYRQIFLVATALPTVAFMTLFFATQPWLLILGPILFGPALAMLTAAIPARVAEAAPGNVRGRAVSYMNAVMMLGQFTAPLLLGPLHGGPFGLRTVFLLAAAISAVAMVAIGAVFHPDRPLGRL